MERIEHFKNQLALKRKQAADSLRCVKSSTGYQPIRSAQAPTLPASFQFATDDRLKDTAVEKKSEKTLDFVAGLRGHSTSPVRQLHVYLYYCNCSFCIVSMVNNIYK